MICSLSDNELTSYVRKQLNNYFPDNNIVEDKDIHQAVNVALKRLEKCFEHITINEYHKDGEVYFNHLHTDQYTQFLYFLGNTLWKAGGDERICSKLVNLIRLISGMFVTYKCHLPEVFIFYHAVGSVIGNAEYSDYLVVFQNVTVNTGQSSDGETVPKLGKGLFLGAGAKIIGNEPVGSRVSIGVDACVYNQAIPDDYVVTMENNTKTVRKRVSDKCLSQSFFDVEI